MIIEAVKKGELGLVKELLEQGEDVNTKTYEDELSLLHLALLNRDEDMARLLIEHGADIEAEDIGGNRPLHLAVALNMPEMVKLLLDLGADINAKARYGRTPIMFSASHKDLRIFEMLVERGANPFDKDYEGSTLLHYAAANRNIPLINRLSLPINITNEKGETPLHFAAWTGDKEVVDLLLEKGAQHIPTTQGLYPLDYAHLSEQMDLVKHLLEKGAPFSTQGYTILHHAAALGRKDIVDLLLPKMDINVEDPDLLTPLHYAVWNEQIDLARYLLERGADPEKKDIWGQTPRDYAKQKNLTL